MGTPSKNKKFQVRIEDRYRLNKRTYVPEGGSVESYERFGTDASEFLDTVEYNLFRDEGTSPLTQQTVVYDNVPLEYVDAYLQLSRRMGGRLMEEMERWLANHDRDSSPEILGTGRAKLGLMFVQIQQTIEESENPN